MEDNSARRSIPGAPGGEVDRVYIQLREWLMEGILAPGSFLAEPDLAARCATSRTPVREACMRLHQDGWLDRYPKKGFLVSPISVRDIVDLYQYRKLLECYAAEKVALSIGPAQMTALRNLLAPEGDPGASAQDLVRANEAFHLQLARLAGNGRVLRQLELTLAFARRLDTLYLQKDPSWIAHDDLLAALEAHHSGWAKEAMAAHLDHCQDCLVKLFGT